jgi:hypothetical protein
LERDTEAKIAETRRALDDARKSLDEALAEARRKREAAEAEEGAPARKPGGVLQDLEERIAQLGGALSERLSVTGTFSSVGLERLGAGSPAERTARATEQTAKNTKRLVDAAITGGLTFA